MENPAGRPKTAEEIDDCRKLHGRNHRRMQERGNLRSHARGSAGEKKGENTLDGKAVLLPIGRVQCLGLSEAQLEG